MPPVSSGPIPYGDATGRARPPGGARALRYGGGRANGRREGTIGMSEGDGLRGRLTRQGEDALGKLAQDLLDNSLVTGAISRAFEARERAVQAQEAAMGALNLPSAADIERLTRRLRSVSQRLEGIEDGVDRLDARLEGLNRATGFDERLAGLEAQLTKISVEIGQLTAALDPAPAPVPREQERLEVDDAPDEEQRRRSRSQTPAQNASPGRS